MKYNFKSKAEADKFLDEIADPKKIQQFAKTHLGITLPDPPKEDSSCN